MNPKLHTRDVIGIHLGLNQEIPAVEQGKCHRLPGVLRCFRPLQHDKRVVLMGRMPAHAAHGLYTLVKAMGQGIPFPPPGAGKLEPVVIGIRKIQVQAHHFFDPHALVSDIRDPCGAGNHSLIPENRIQKFELKSGHRIRQLQDQGRGFTLFIGKCGRQSGKARFSLQHLIPIIDKIRQPAPVFLQDLQRALTEIRASVHGILLAEMLERQAAVVIHDQGRMGAQSPLHQPGILFPVVNPSPEIQLARITALQHRHNVTDFVVLKMESPGFFMNMDLHSCHTPPPCSHFCCSFPTY